MKKISPIRLAGSYATGPKRFLTFFLTAFLSFATAQTYDVSTIAGTGTGGYSDGTALTSQFQDPSGIVMVDDSILYIADTYNNVIRKLNLNTNLVTTIAGTGVQGYQDGPASSAQFDKPGQLVYSNGVLYLVDNANHAIRKIDLGTYMVSTVAGTGTAGHQDGAAASAKFNSPGTIVVTPGGDLLVADCYNHCIRKISGGIVTTIAGIPNSSGFVNGTASTAKFNYPRSLALDSSGDLYIAEINNHVIRKLSGTTVTTFAGTGADGGTDGAIVTATFSSPVAISLTPSGSHLFVVDGTCRVRSIDMSSATVSTIAGTTATGYVDGPGIIAQFNYPQAIIIDPDGDLLIADRMNHVIRKIITPTAQSGIGEAETYLINFNLFPNPATGKFTVSFPAADFSGIIRIYNAEGKFFGEFSVSDGESVPIDLTGVPAGIYFVNLQSKSGSKTDRIVIID